MRSSSSKKWGNICAVQTFLSTMPHSCFKLLCIVILVIFIMKNKANFLWKKSSDLKNVYNILIIQVPWVMIWLKKSWLEFKLNIFTVVTWYFFWGVHIWGQKEARHPLWKYYALGFVRSYCKEIFKDEHVSFNIYCQHQRSCFLWSLMKNIILPKHNICLFYSPIHIAVIIIKSAYWMVGSMGNDALRVYRVFHSNYHIIHKCSNFKIKLEHLVNIYICGNYQNYTVFQN